jgi:hypothetical protein
LLIAGEMMKFAARVAFSISGPILVRSWLVERPEGARLTYLSCREAAAFFVPLARYPQGAAYDYRKSYMIDRSKKLPAFFYENAMGNRPVREWILGLSVEDRKLIGRDVQKVEFGWPLGMPYCRSLDPTNTSVTLHTLQRAALAVGHQLRLKLV